MGSIRDSQKTHKYEDRRNENTQLRLLNRLLACLDWLTYFYLLTQAIIRLLEEVHKLFSAYLCKLSMTTYIKTVWLLEEVHKLFSAYLHKFFRIVYENS